MDFTTKDFNLKDGRWAAERLVGARSPVEPRVDERDDASGSQAQVRFT